MPRQSLVHVDTDLRLRLWQAAEEEWHKIEFVAIGNGTASREADRLAAGLTQRHPEAYPVVRRILQATRSDLKRLIGNAPIPRGLAPENFTDEKFGIPTVTDILKELEKPGRGPRPAFKTATFLDGIEKLEDLKPGMILEGVVTNVAVFGAFVDIGVHRDGLVHRRGPRS
jgi:transcriptional accessory protein Tex/SPT6